MKRARMFGVCVSLGGAAVAATMLGACGQGGEGQVSLEVQMLSVSGVLEGNELSETYPFTGSAGERGRTCRVARPRSCRGGT
jgi:hypothetical protein